MRDGQPAMAEIIAVQDETSAVSDERVVRVTYEFEADGQRRRDTDRLLPLIASRWQPGDQVQVLYLPEDAYDSVIISAG